MLKYYSYYNVGGYKDMFLGDSTMLVKSTYFVPLYYVWKKKAVDGDSSALEKIELVEKLPSINLITNEAYYGLPKSAETLFHHAGYKVYLSLLSTGECVYAIRDIDGVERDESGRTIPFLLVIVGTTDADRAALEKLTAYTVSHIDEISNKYAGLFSYNAKYNAIEFDLKAINELIEDISIKNNNSFATISKTIVVDSKKKDIALFAIPEGLDMAVAMREQNVKGKSVNVVNMSDILPLDNPEKMKLMLTEYRQRKLALSKKRLIWLVVGIIAVATMLCLIL